MTRDVLRRLAIACLSASLAVAAASAGAAELPIYPVDANCREATGVFFGGSQLSAARKQAFERDCVRRQQGAYDAVKNVWPSLEVKDQLACIRIVRTTNYLHLARCVSGLYEQELLVRRADNRPFKP